VIPQEEDVLKYAKTYKELSILYDKEWKSVERDYLQDFPWKKYKIWINILLWILIIINSVGYIYLYKKIGNRITKYLKHDALKRCGLGRHSCFGCRELLKAKSSNSLCSGSHSTLKSGVSSKTFGF